MLAKLQSKSTKTTNIQAYDARRDVLMT